MSKQRVVLATGNPGKVKEMASLLAEFGLDVVPQSELSVGDVAETGTTFVENAIIKARHAAQVTGLPAIADDSGLEVDALDGTPGVYSARYAKPEDGYGQGDKANLNKLLDTLKQKQLPSEQRSARFHCVLVFMRHANDPTPLICHGSWEGQIALAEQGDGGFGYDPVFLPAELAAKGDPRTAAELSKAEKHQLSHRGKALSKLVAALKTVAL